MPRQKKSETIKESKLEIKETATEELKQEEALGVHSEIKTEPTEEVEIKEETVVAEEEVQELPEEVLPDLDNLDLSEFETEPEAVEEPLLTVKELEKQSDIVSFKEFYSLHWKLNWRLISWIVGLDSVKGFNSEIEFAEVAYRRMASWSLTRGALRKGGQTMADLMVIGGAFSKVMPEVFAERKEKKQAKELLKQGENEDEQTQGSNFDQFIAR